MGLSNLIISQHYFSNFFPLTLQGNSVQLLTDLGNFFKFSELTLNNLLFETFGKLTILKVILNI